MIDENRHANDRDGDLVDLADRSYQVHLDAQIRGITSQKIDMSNPSQECWHCGRETASNQHRWCSPECRDDWSKENV